MRSIIVFSIFFIWFETSCQTMVTAGIALECPVYFWPEITEYPVYRKSDKLNYGLSANIRVGSNQVHFISGLQYSTLNFIDTYELKNPSGFETHKVVYKGQIISLPVLMELLVFRNSKISFSNQTGFGYNLLPYIRKTNIAYDRNTYDYSYNGKIIGSRVTIAQGLSLDLKMGKGFTRLFIMFNSTIKSFKEVQQDLHPYNWQSKYDFHTGLQYYLYL